MRKSLFIAIFDKVANLSMKSMTETNSGKVITIVNADVQAIERQLSFIPLMLISPVINILAYIIIGLECGWIYSLVTFTIWILVLCCQVKTA